MALQLNLESLIRSPLNEKRQKDLRWIQFSESESDWGIFLLAFM